MITTLFNSTRSAALSAILLVLSVIAASSQVAPNLGTAKAYGIFTGAGAIDNTGLSIVVGNIGTYVGAFTGFPPGIYTGELHIADADALSAKNDLTTAYNSMNDAANAIMFDEAIGATMGNGQVLTSKTYGREDVTTIDGDLSFDAEGNPDAVFIIKIRAALNVSKFTKIKLLNGAKALNIYWAVDGAVSVLDSSVFLGTVIANGAIHFYGGSTLEGSALAVVGAITLASNLVSGPNGFGEEANLQVVTPKSGDTLQAGTTNYQISWKGSGIAPVKILALSLDSGATWRDVDTVETSAFTRGWTVIDTVSSKAIIRVTDANGLEGESGVFTIVKAPSITMVTPTASTRVNSGTQNFQIVWKGNGIQNPKTIEYSLDSGATWSLIGTTSRSGFAYSWNVPDTSSTKAMVRVTDGKGLRATSAAFAIIRTVIPSSITVVRPARAEALVGATQNYTISWIGTNIGAEKTIELSLDSGATWSPVASINSASLSHSWSVPDVSTTTAVIRITDNKGTVGRSGAFTIVATVSSESSIVIFNPNAGTVVEGGFVNFPIGFTAINTTPIKTFEYSLDSGETWSLIGTASVTGQTFSWPMVPNTATTAALVRATDENGTVGTSSPFTITTIDSTGTIDNLELDGIDDFGNIVNGAYLGISWTSTSNIGTFVHVEFSMDFGVTWERIATVTTDAPPFASWLTPMSGTFNPVFIRVISENGATRASEPFSINSGTSSVSTGLSLIGYELSSYPNPSAGATHVLLTVPTSGRITIVLVDQRGSVVQDVLSQQFDAGTYTIPVNTSALASGMYTCVVTTGGGRITSHVVISK